MRHLVFKKHKFISTTKRLRSSTTNNKDEDSQRWRWWWRRLNWTELNWLYSQENSCIQSYSYRTDRILIANIWTYKRAACISYVRWTAERSKKRTTFRTTINVVVSSSTTLPPTTLMFEFLMNYTSYLLFFFFFLILLVLCFLEHSLSGLPDDNYLKYVKSAWISCISGMLVPEILYCLWWPSRSITLAIIFAYSLIN